MATRSDNLPRRFARIYTAAITDVMAEMGLQRQTLPSALQPLTMGGVRGTLGGVVVADLDGVVVGRRRAAHGVLVRCEKLVGTENKVRTAVKRGMAPLAAYEKFGSF